MYSPLFAGMLGVLAHHVLFIHGEWHLWAPTLVSIHVISGGLLVAIEVALKKNPKGIKFHALIAIPCYLIFLSISIAIYRIYFTAYATSRALVLLLRLSYGMFGSVKILGST